MGGGVLPGLLPEVTLRSPWAVFWRPFRALEEETIGCYGVDVGMIGWAGAGGGDDWMLWGGCLGFAVSDGAEEGGDGDGDADSCDDAASVTDVCDG